MFGVGASAGENDGDIESNAEGRSRRPNDHSPSSVTTVRAPLNFGQYRGASDSAADRSVSMRRACVGVVSVGAAAALPQFGEERREGVLGVPGSSSTVRPVCSYCANFNCMETTFQAHAFEEA